MAKKFGYNGTEYEGGLGYDVYEMPLRKYDPTIARWSGIDPVTHHSQSTYNAFDGNPVYFADPSGADSRDMWGRRKYDRWGNYIAPYQRGRKNYGYLMRPMRRKKTRWIPYSTKNGTIQLYRESGDNLPSLKKFLKKSGFTSRQIEKMYNSSNGVFINLIVTNYSKAIEYANNNKDKFYTLLQLREMPYEVAERRKNYNCYHFALNIALGNDVKGNIVMDTEDFHKIVNSDKFTKVSSNEAIFGRTIITMNYSGGYAMHAAIYAGTDTNGNVYILDKFGAHAPPSLRILTGNRDIQYKDFQYYNPK